MRVTIFSTDDPVQISRLFENEKNRKNARTGQREGEPAAQQNGTQHTNVETTTPRTGNSEKKVHASVRKGKPPPLTWNFLEELLANSVDSSNFTRYFSLLCLSHELSRRLLSVNSLSSFTNFSFFDLQHCSLELLHFLFSRAHHHLHCFFPVYLLFHCFFPYWTRRCHDWYMLYPFWRWLCLANLENDIVPLYGPILPCNLHFVRLVPTQIFSLC